MTVIPKIRILKVTKNTDTVVYYPQFLKTNRKFLFFWSLEDKWCDIIQSPTKSPYTHGLKSAQLEADNFIKSFARDIVEEIPYENKELQLSVLACNLGYSSEEIVKMAETLGFTPREIENLVKSFKKDNQETI